MQFSKEVAALIGDLLASQVPSWVRTAVLANRKMALWVTAGEGSLSVIGLCQKDCGNVLPSFREQTDGHCFINWSKSGLGSVDWLERMLIRLSVGDTLP
ncbi:hypothetical protein SKAU_G00412620 [Synaphobranchus kaupii]|uniref:Uncharacterized protein n=1 Tax=Synaphobranchus kaupii TaxID=118154 RepID=A0A9Q1I9Y1_SYNKA|nr:hypothetical protein SKAU_G00412620 [Synaphobranchus kaupii]